MPQKKWGRTGPVTQAEIFNTVRMNGTLLKRVASKAQNTHTPFFSSQLGVGQRSRAGAG